MNRILFLAVNYRSNDDALRLAESIDRLESSERIDVLVVDNSESPDREHELYRRERVGFGSDSSGGFAVLGDGHNRGYFGGAYYGLRAYQASAGVFPEWVIVGNCDLDPATDDLVAKLDALVTTCERDNVGVLAPAIRSTRSGSDQNPYYVEAPSARKYLGLSVLFRSYPLAIAYRLLAHRKQKRAVPGGAHSGKVQIGSTHDIFAGHGSCMLFHRRFFEAGGTLEYEPFLYCEEVHVGAQARKLGLRVRYEPSLAFSHREHGTISLFPSKKIVAHLADAHYYAYRHYLRGDRVAAGSETIGVRTPGAMRSVTR